VSTDAWRGVAAEKADEVTAGLAALLRERSRRLLGDLLRPHRRAVITTISLIVVESLAALAGPWLVGLAIDNALPPLLHAHDAAPLLAIAHHNECPVLCIARRRRSNGGIQNAGDDLLRDRVGFESAQGSCGVDGVEQSDLRHREPHSVLERLPLRLSPRQIRNVLRTFIFSSLRPHVGACRLKKAELTFSDR